ncbi:hypothetical protein HPB50_018114 [Hyalomma asiaticum]|uniref:Uncharacterized protein n=1 Tax=Hyalomma asiaticum TaxID=266040 RepID=A0ACB7RZT9_HYAAI|nr:hypothetical protein HPB50_018114 [Hyalomma asiaticum]
MSSTVLNQPATDTASATRVQQQQASKDAHSNQAIIALNKLGLSLFRQVAEHLDHNVLLCPAAVTSSLLAAQACAEGETHLQLLELLVKEGGKVEQLQAAVQSVFEEMEKDKANSEAALTYRMFVSRAVEMNEACEAQLRSQLRCVVDRVSFHVTSAEDVAFAVNGSFADASPLIGEVLAPEAVDPSVKILLASAFYYRQTPATQADSTPVRSTTLPKKKKKPSVARPNLLPRPTIEARDDRVMSSTVLNQPATDTASATRVQQQQASKDAHSSQAIIALNKLGLSLFRQVAEHLDHNVLLCPAAVTSSLLAAQACAEGETHLQLLELLVKEGGKVEQLQAAVQSVFEEMEKDKANSEAALTYRMFVSRAVEMNEACEAQLRSQLRCVVDRVSFHVTSAEDVAFAVNGSFADASPLIGEVLAPEAVDPSVKILLASAFYYRGILQPPFTRNPAERHFKSKSATGVPLEFERGAGTFMHAEVEDPVAVKVLELPYRGGATSLLLLLPDRVRLVKDLVAQLTPAVLAKLAGSLKPRNVRVEMPLAKIEARYTLNTTLIHAGVKQAFMPSADFTNLVPAGEVRLGDMLHKATLVLDEGRPTATRPLAKLSDTEKLDVDRSASVPPAEVQFELTRPFIFVLRNTHNGCILLVGVVNDLKKML